MKTINFNSTVSSIKSFIENKISKTELCSLDVIKQLQKGDYQFKGHQGRIIISNGNAYKLEESIGSYSFKEVGIMSDFYLQNIISYLIYNDLPDKLKDNTIKPIDFFTCGSDGISIFEECNLGDLSGFIKNQIELKNFQQLDINIIKCLNQISKVLKYLEDNHGFIHNDLKMDNILVHRHHSEKDSEDTIHFKISDFGNSMINMKYVKNLKKSSFFEFLIPLPTIKDIDEDRYIIEPYFNFKIDGFLYRNNFDKKIYNDLYILLFSMIFSSKIKENMEKFPLINQLFDLLFDQEDIEKIKNEMYGDDMVGSDSPIYVNHLVGFIINSKIKLYYDINEKMINFTEFLLSQD